MAYIDKCFYHDLTQRKIELRNHKDGWKDDWDLESITLRKRMSGDDECLAVEVWPTNYEKDHVELILSKDSAAKLAYRILMSLAEMNVEDVIENQRQDVERLKNQMDWLEPIILERQAAWKKSREEAQKGA